MNYLQRDGKPWNSVCWFCFGSGGGISLHLIRDLVSSMGWSCQIQSADGRFAQELGGQKVPGFVRHCSDASCSTGRAWSRFWVNIWEACCGLRVLSNQERHIIFVGRNENHLMKTFFLLISLIWAAYRLKWMKWNRCFCFIILACLGKPLSKYFMKIQMSFGSAGFISID